MIHKKSISYICRITLLIVVLLAGSSSALFSTALLGANTTPAHITLTWVDDPVTTQTITWRTEGIPVAGQVQYVEAGEVEAFLRNAKTVEAGVEQLSTNLGDVTIHSVKLAGLKPGTHYLYRVGNETGWSELRTFVTSLANVSEFKFLVFGDSQSVNYDVWRTTLQQAYQANPDAAFLINVGDLVDVGQDYAQWNAWFDAARGVIDTISAMPATGNHESYTPERGNYSLPVFFTAQFKLPPNGPAGLIGQTYSFDYGDTHFVMLDSQECEEARFLPDMLERQKRWLEKDLAATDKKWKLVFLHRPPYHRKSAGSNENIRRAFVPIFDQYHVDIVFNGHEHVYARTYPLHSDVVVDSAAKGTIYVTTGRSGTKTYKDMSANDWDEVFHNPLDEPNYITVEVRGSVLSVKAFKQSGILLDTWTINKDLAWIRISGYTPTGPPHF
jgi:acid phosphatase type 7